MDAISKPLTARRLGQTVANGDPVGTNGEKSGTSGWPPLTLFGVIAGFLLAVILVNISSNLIENPDLAAWKPTLWEFSSYIGILVFVPALWWSWRRFHWTHAGVARFLTAQIISFLLFSGGHIAVLVLLRHIGYLLVGQHYDFSNGRLPLELIYEGRKDFLTFVLIGGMFWTHERLRAPAHPTPPARIEVRADGRTVFLTPDEIVSVEAAGNYVELHLTTGKPLLTRATLADYEDRLGAGFARVHRSRLVNRLHIREMSVTPAGDPHLLLSDGRTLSGSRRYRDRLKAG
jgi:hypothetical protein